MTYIKSNHLHLDFKPGDLVLNTIQRKINSLGLVISVNTVMIDIMLIGGHWNDEIRGKIFKYAVSFSVHVWELA